ncbi:hypothetical protein ACHAXR_007788 [Thalassiosira sp. AJA248-18]
MQINEVMLRPEMYPGGTFAISRTGSEVGSWIRPGDLLLFDVVQKVVDGSCFAVPTKCVVPKKKGAAAAAPGDGINGDSTTTTTTTVAAGTNKPSIRLIEPSLCGRSTGIIRSIHDNYGFINHAERNVDVYFPLFEVFPTEIQGDLVRNNAADAASSDDAVDRDNEKSSGGDDEKKKKKETFIQNKGGRIHVEVGMEVSFDLSLQMLTNAGGTGGNDRGRGGDRGGRYGNKQNSRGPPVQEKESLRARRIQILPKGSVTENIVIASKVKSVVSKEDPKQPFVGTIELDESIKLESATLRHPMVAKLVDSISEGKYGEEVTFHDVLSDRDAQVVIFMVNGREDLEWRYVPESAAGDPHGRKLCIAVKKSDDHDAVAAAKGEEATAAGEEESDPTAQPPVVEVSATSESANGDNDGMVAGGGRTLEKSASTSSSTDKPESHKKKGAKSRAKIVKLIRFGKFSFPDMSIGPIGVGDVVTCDIVLSRRSGVISAENITVVERKERPPSAGVALVSDGEDGKENNGTQQRKGLSGFVTEVVPSRQFGFITAVDEQGSKTGEHVFFHFREVESSAAAAAAGDVAQDGGGSSPSSLARVSKKSGGGRSVSDTVPIHKGDEVKFDAGPGKNGKLNATKISILPRGTLKMSVKTEKTSSSCTGYILMEPSHTSLANSPSHNIVLQGSGGPAAAGAGGRWANVRDEKSHKTGSNVKEGGVILLVSDPSHSFSLKPNVIDSPAKKDSAVVENKSGSADDSATESNTGTDTENDGVKAEAKGVVDKDTPEQSSAVGTHLRYKLSSMASRGSSNRSDGPKRGDLVSFGKTRGANLVKDIRIQKMGAATSVRGVLVDINTNDDTAVLVSSENETRYEIKLSEVVSCGKSLLKDKEQVDGILHEGKIFGVCRTKDIYLSSSIGRNSSGSSGGLKERPKLNLTVKKELQGMGGKIMAQSRMAKGPDGTNGFAPGWTKRVSLYVEEEEEEEEDSASLLAAASLSAAANEFVPNFAPSLPPIAVSGFESVETDEGNDGE